MADHVSRHVEARRSGGTVVVDIVYRDFCHAELVEDALTAGAIAIAVASNGLLDIIVINLGVQESFDTGFEA